MQYWLLISYIPPFCIFKKYDFVKCYTTAQYISQTMFQTSTNSNTFSIEGMPQKTGKVRGIPSQ